MTLYPVQQSVNSNTQVLGFVKEGKFWYADLPEFLEQGLGTRADLLMVDGSDDFLDILSDNGTAVVTTISKVDFKGADAKMRKVSIGKNQTVLDNVGHAPVDYGAYYDVYELYGQPFSHRLWLCPVTEYVLGEYPDSIFIQIQNYKDILIGPPCR
jgi:hypothetical protein